VSEAVVAPSKVSGHTVLAFDFGARWIGVAVGDTVGTGRGLASPAEAGGFVAPVVHPASQPATSTRTPSD